MLIKEAIVLLDGDTHPWPENNYHFHICNIPLKALGHQEALVPTSNQDLSSHQLFTKKVGIDKSTILMKMITPEVPQSIIRQMQQAYGNGCRELGFDTEEIQAFRSSFDSRNFNNMELQVPLLSKQDPTTYSHSSCSHVPIFSQCLLCLLAHCKVPNNTSFIIQYPL